jgi:hypothetical protein
MDIDSDYSNDHGQTRVVRDLNELFKSNDLPKIDIPRTPKKGKKLRSHKLLASTSDTNTPEAVNRLLEVLPRTRGDYKIFEALLNSTENPTEIEGAINRITKNDHPTIKDRQLLLPFAERLVESLKYSPVKTEHRRQFTSGTQRLRMSTRGKSKSGLGSDNMLSKDGTPRRRRSPRALPKDHTRRLNVRIGGKKASCI